ncbi:ArsR/SmtB family transcription factor [Virgibacillus kekensis]|uniref:ArsR/SmtB family transcription factor n=1 Tax=Virgibacillus kekensis TaxID=202261 RepID=A0ABV9DQS9_9BACI
MEKTGVRIDDMVPVLKLLGDRTRLTIVFLLNRNPCCVCELVEVLEMSQPSISQHLRKLRDARMVTEERRGQWIYYSINKESSSYGLVENVLELLPAQKEWMEKLNEAKANTQC